MKASREVCLILVVATAFALSAVGALLSAAGLWLLLPQQPQHRPLHPPPIAPKEATTITAQINAALLEELPFADQQDFEDAQRGFIATLPEVVIKAEDGHTVWSLKGYEFLQQEEPPPSINPSLWRMAQLNMNNGLFRGHRPHLPGARLRRLQHDHHRGRHRSDPHRPA